MKRYIISIVMLSVIVILNGCGSSSSDSTPPDNNEPKIIDSGIINGTSYFTVKGSKFNYRLTNGCHKDSIYAINAYIYDDFTVKTVSPYSTKYCMVKKMYQEIALKDGDVNATYLNETTYYDNNTSIYYELDESPYRGTDGNLINISNNGLLAKIYFSYYNSSYYYRMNSAWKEIK